MLFVLTSSGRVLPTEAADDPVAAEGEGAADVAADPAAQAAEAVKRLAQLVHVVVRLAGRRQVRRPEAAQQQRQEQVQNLKAVKYLGD